MNSTLIIILTLLLILVGIVWLQVFLSKKKNKWLGLVTPMICIMFSIMFVLSMSMYTTNKTSRIETVDKVLIKEAQVEDNIAKPSVGKMVAMATPTLLVTNIPTIILLAIYFACREKINRNNELEKMNVQDLE